MLLRLFLKVAFTSERWENRVKMSSAPLTIEDQVMTDNRD